MDLDLDFDVRAQSQFNNAAPTVAGQDKRLAQIGLCRQRHGNPDADNGQQRTSRQPETIAQRTLRRKTISAAQTTA